MTACQVATSFFALGIMPFVSGVPLVCARDTSGATNRNESISLRRGALVTTLFFGTSVSVLLFVLARPSASLAGNPDAALAVQAACRGIFACCISSVLRASFQGRGEMLPLAISQISESALHFAVGVGLATLLFPMVQPMRRQAQRQGSVQANSAH